MTDLTRDEQEILLESVRPDAMARTRLAWSLGTGLGNGWRVVCAMLDRRLQEVVTTHEHHVRPTGAGRAAIAADRT